MNSGAQAVSTTTTTSSNNNNNGKEVIHVALGDVSCRISTHLHHIQGLSCTTVPTSSLYDHHVIPSTLSTPTHTTTYQEKNHILLVPRSILVGNVTSSSSSSSHDITQNDDALTHHHHDDITTWSGRIETFSRQRMILSSKTEEEENNDTLFGVQSRATTTSGTGPTTSTNHGSSYNSNAPALPLPPRRNDYGPYSRYWVGSSSTQQKNRNSTHNDNYYYKTTPNARHVNWEEEMLHKNEHEDDDDDDDDLRAQQQEAQLKRWKQDSQIAQNAMDDYWQSYYHDDSTTDRYSTAPVTHHLEDTHHHLPSHQNTTVDRSAIPTMPLLSSSTSSFNTIHAALTWYDYLQLSTMPYHPTHTLVDVHQSSPLVRQFQQRQPSSPSTDEKNLDHDTTSNNVSYYQALQEDTNFVETILWEQHIRTLLEQCDSCQGIMLLQDNHTNVGSHSTSRSSNGIYTGWGTNLLQLWNDECPHTVQLSIPVSTTDQSNDHLDVDDAVVHMRPSPRNTVRDHIQQSLLLSDQTLLSTVVLPIQLPSVGTVSFSQHAATAAAVAMAMECATLPFRIVDGSSNTSSKAQLALQSYYSSSHGSTGIPNLSYREFVRTLQRQSTSRNVLELDTILPWNTNHVASSSSTNKSLLELLQQGTSIERDHRMKQSGYQSGIHRPTDTPPGEWMNTHVDGSADSSTGMLSSLSPHVSATTTGRTNGSKNNMYDRNLHYHYALSTSLRPPSNNNRRSNEPAPKISSYVTSIMESMGIRYRPEQTLCAVLDQSYEDLLCTHGSYWKYIFRGCALPGKSSMQPFGNLSVVGNTTRIYPYLVQTASNGQQIISPRNKKSINRSIYNHDVTMGVAPEMDDFNEAVTTCLDIRDSYEPPHGSGLILDEEGEYFDMS